MRWVHHPVCPSFPWPRFNDSNNLTPFPPRRVGGGNRREQAGTLHPRVLPEGCTFIAGPWRHPQGGADHVGAGRFRLDPLPLLRRAHRPGAGRVRKDEWSFRMQADRRVPPWWVIARRSHHRGVPPPYGGGYSVWTMQRPSACGVGSTPPPACLPVAWWARRARWCGCRVRLLRG